jgi:hypothetical protein
LGQRHHLRENQRLMFVATDAAQQIKAWRLFVATAEA